MAETTHIEWTDATWNPITGCSVTSPGCTNCYAMKLAGTRLQHHPSRAGLTVDSKAGPVWNGKVRFNRDWLDQPIGWKRPRRIFVCAHGDLFHESVPFAWIDRVFGAMAVASQHTFQVLTKRADRMLEYMTDNSQARADGRGKALVDLGYRGPMEAFSWPLPNVWLGVSAEDQERWNERVGELIRTPAAVRWVSAEPLLGRIFADGHIHLIDWLVVGGESGPRPMHPDWVRELRDAASAVGTPFFFKQWGSHAWVRRVEADPSTLTAYRVPKKVAGRLLDGVLHDARPEVR